MAFSKLFDSRSQQPEPYHADGSDTYEGEKGPIDATNTVLNTEDGEQSTLAQDGVKKAQATTIVWTRKALIVAYAL